MSVLRFSLCPDCANCPEVVIDSDTIAIGEEGNLVRLSPAEWNVLVAGIKDGRLQPVPPVASTEARDADCGCGCGCCASAK
ncbi:MAG: hypothetical protein Kow0010_05310 [Dehalococcoidia bacterium]